MKNVTEYLTEYAAYHRDRRNIAIHSVGIPLIVFALIILSARPAVPVFGVQLRLCTILVGALVSFYIGLDLALAAGFTIVACAMVYAGVLIAWEPTTVWLASGVGIFALGWALQFIGHGWEGKKPAFLDDIMGLAIGPLFVTAEAFFAAGKKTELKHAIEANAGPTYIRTGPAKASPPAA